MTYDYADWADDDYGSGDGTAVTFIMLGDADDAVRFRTEALDGDVKLDFTLAPEDTLDFLHRFLVFTDLDVGEVQRVVRDVENERAERWTKQAFEAAGLDADPDHERDRVLDDELLVD